MSHLNSFGWNEKGTKGDLVIMQLKSAAQEGFLTTNREGEPQSSYQFQISMVFYRQKDIVESCEWYLKFGTGEMSQQVKAPATKHDSLSFLLGPTWWKERSDSCKLFPDIYMCAVACTCLHKDTNTHTHTHTRPDLAASHVRKVFLISKAKDYMGGEVGCGFCSRQHGQMLWWWGELGACADEASWACRVATTCFLALTVLLENCTGEIPCSLLPLEHKVSSFLPLITLIL